MSPIGKTSSNGAGVFETNAVVFAAGAGALPTTEAATVTEARKELLASGVDVSSSGVQRIDLHKNDGAQAGVFLSLGLVLRCCTTKEECPGCVCAVRTTFMISNRMYLVCTGGTIVCISFAMLCNYISGGNLPGN